MCEGVNSTVTVVDMKQYLSTIINNKGEKRTGGGGEGVVLRRPLSLYEHGKSLSVLKAKVCEFRRITVVVVILVFQNMIDAEALVVQIKGSQYVCKLYV